jgi:peptide/nickel transport system ATP-binding protein
MSGFLEVDHVAKAFRPTLSLDEKIAARLGSPVETRALQAVDDVSLHITQGETLGLVGESGCGKSTLGRIIAGIITPDTGAVRIGGAPIMLGERKLTTRVQTVFQDPYASLDPRMKVGEAVAEGPIAHGLVSRTDAPAYVAEWFARVGLDPDAAPRYPHQFSGGQRQRIAIARALAMQPELLVCDEPVASLDVSIQAQILNLFMELRRDLGLTCVFISHDLSVVRHVSDRMAVMYLGRIVEIGQADAVFAKPAHPYTAALLASVPRLELADDALVAFDPIKGEIPSALAPPPGCHFAPRCALAQDICRAHVPPLAPVAHGADDRPRRAACHFADRQLSM